MLIWEEKKLQYTGDIALFCDREGLRLLHLLILYLIYFLPFYSISTNGNRLRKTNFKVLKLNIII